MSLPKPEAGLVVSYGYFWRHEHNAGAEEGRKNRPCVIVVSVEQRDGDTIVAVAPITHRKPVNDSMAIEIPLAVKKMLTLDMERSWVMIDEMNQFVWPGYDLEIVPGIPRRYAYGFLPPGLFNKIKDAVIQGFSNRKLAVTRRH